MLRGGEAAHSLAFGGVADLAEECAEPPFDCGDVVVTIRQPWCHW
jgi:hypothetical protein